MKVLKNIQVKTWTIVILVMYIIFLQECNKPNKEYENTDTIDTVFTRMVDSIYVLDTVYLTTNTLSIDTIYINNDTIKRYKKEVEDEVLKGTITSDVDGTLINQDFQYTLLWGGGDMGGNSGAFNISATAGVTNKKGNSYYYRYNILRKEHSIGLTRTLYKY